MICTDLKAVEIGEKTQKGSELIKRNVVNSQSNDNGISYMIPLRIWHYYGFGGIGNADFL